MTGNVSHRNRIIRLVIVLGMLLMVTLQAQSVWADTEQDVTVYNEQPYAEDVIRTEESSDSDDLLLGYLDQEVSERTKTAGARVSSKAAKVTRGSRLTGANAVVYRLMRTQIERIAAGELSSSIIEVSPTDLGLKKYYSASDLGVTELFSGNQFTTATKAAMSEVFTAVDIRSVLDALLSDCPYDLYWYDKTTGTFPYRPGYRLVERNGAYYIELQGNFVYKMSVSQDYAVAGESYRVDTTRTSAAAKAVRNVAYILAEARSKARDDEKLELYRDKILDLAEYNYDAVRTTNTAYGDPWQIVYVFDGDPDTKVVCEGYSKAFQYLADRGNMDRIAVYSVSGTMWASAKSGRSGGNHMWNIVSIDGVRYMADLTNSDTGMVGSKGELYLGGMDGSVSAGYRTTCGGHTMEYSYDAATKRAFSEEELTLSHTRYEPKADSDSASEPTDTPVSGNDADADSTDVDSSAVEPSHGEQTPSPAIETPVAEKPAADPFAAKIAGAKKAKVSGLMTRVKKRKYTVSWKKRRGVSGYQIQYNRKGRKSWKTISSGTTKLRVYKKLAKGKRYRFRVRTYTKINGRKYYSSWKTGKYVKCR